MKADFPFYIELPALMALAIGDRLEEGNLRSLNSMLLEVVSMRFLFRTRTADTFIKIIIII
jgi:hypothetical protein